MAEPMENPLEKIINDGDLLREAQRIELVNHAMQYIENRGVTIDQLYHYRPLTKEERRRYALSRATRGLYGFSVPDGKYHPEMKVVYIPSGSRHSSVVVQEGSVHELTYEEEFAYENDKTVSIPGARRLMYQRREWGIDDSSDIGISVSTAPINLFEPLPRDLGNDEIDLEEIDRWVMSLKRSDYRGGVQQP